MLLKENKSSVSLGDYFIMQFFGYFLGDKNWIVGMSTCSNDV